MDSGDSMVVVSEPVAQTSTNSSDITAHEIADAAVIERPESPRTRSAQHRDEIVNKAIGKTAKTGCNVLDISRKGIKTIPDAVLQLGAQLEYLYLEGNELTSLPDDIFDRLPGLKWLDLRHNYITHIPGTYLGSLQQLRHLLLEGNELRTLPLELGLIASLNGLNICNNPLDFPPIEVVERGTKELLAYLRDLLRAKAARGQHGPVTLDRSASDSPTHSEEGSLSSHHRHGQLAPLGGGSRKQSTLSGDNRNPDDAILGPVPLSASLHPPVSYDEIKQLKNETYRKVLENQQLNTMPRRKPRSNRPLAPQSPTQAQAAADVMEDVVRTKARQDKRLARQREFLDKQSLILQRRKDQETLRQWREDGKKLKNKKIMQNGQETEFVAAVDQAPFGIDKEHLNLPNREDKIRQEIKDTHNNVRRAMTPNSRRRADDAKASRDRELQRKIKEHAREMQERRKKPKGNPREEMAAARQELEVAEHLQRELSSRRKELEYRFRAFTGEISYSPQGKMTGAKIIL